MCNECKIAALEKQVTSLQTLNTELTLKNRSAWLPTIQAEHNEWNNKQPWANKSKDAGVPSFFEPMLGISEEVGELSHAFLKLYQGIRGTEAEHIAAAKDAIGDINIYIIHLCNKMGWDLKTIIDDTWNVVKNRDWKKDNLNGGETTTVQPLQSNLKSAVRFSDVSGLQEQRKALHKFTKPNCNCHSHLCEECGQRFEDGDHIGRTGREVDRHFYNDFNE